MRLKHTRWDFALVVRAVLDRLVRNRLDLRRLDIQRHLLRRRFSLPQFSRGVVRDMDIHLTVEFGAVARARLDSVGKRIATVSVKVKSLLALTPVLEGRVRHFASLNVNLGNQFNHIDNELI